MRKTLKAMLVVALFAVLLPGAEAAEDFTTGSGESSIRVLVTGFSDWIGVDEDELFLCERNPSCRILFSQDGAEGLLPAFLMEADERIEWTFLTLPVTWDAHEYIVDIQQYDVVIHLGMNSRQRFDVLLMEDGAYNGAFGKDVLGKRVPQQIEASKNSVLASSDVVQTTLGALQTMVLERHSVQIAAAGAGNTYVCNALYYRTLRVHDAVYFIHLPRTSDANLPVLAIDLGTLIVRILDGYGFG